MYKLWRYAADDAQAYQREKEVADVALLKAAFQMLISLWYKMHFGGLCALCVHLMFLPQCIQREMLLSSIPLI